MTVLRFGLTPKMKPVSPKRAAVVAGLDIGTSKIVCLIARLEPQAPQDVLRRRSHGVRLLAFAHTAASGMKAGSVERIHQGSEVLPQRSLEPRIRCAHSDVDLTGALHNVDVHGSFRPLNSYCNALRRRILRRGR